MARVTSRRTLRVDSPSPKETEMFFTSAMGAPLSAMGGIYRGGMTRHKRAIRCGGSGDGNSGAGNLVFEMRELAGDGLVLVAVLIDGADSVEDGRVIAAPEVAADFLEAVARVA